MLSIAKCTAPANTLLRRYSMIGAYTDCYWTEVPGRVSFSEFILAFYTTPLFRLERVILKLFVTKPSTDLQAKQLAEGICDTFAAWHVEARSANEILMCDFRGRTRSWLMVVPADKAGGTQLYFGSAVIPKPNAKTRTLSLGFGYQALLGFHQIYSVLLLYSAKLRLQHPLGSSYEKQDQFDR